MIVKKDPSEDVFQQQQQQQPKQEQKQQSTSAPTRNPTCLPNGHCMGLIMDHPLKSSSSPPTVSSPDVEPKTTVAVDDLVAKKKVFHPNHPWRQRVVN
jgi:hypothetical protein